MILYLKILLGFAFAVGVLALNEDGTIARWYADGYADMSDYYQARLPQKFAGLMQFLAFAAWLVIATTLYYHLDKPRGPDQKFLRFHPGFFQKLYAYFQIYFNNRLHELEKNTLTHFLQLPAAHETAIVGVLYALRHALIHAYKPADVRVTLLIMQRKDDGVRRLYVEYWANASRRTPTTRKVDFGFEKGVGFAGWAWQEGRPQAGSKRTILGVPDKRYVNTSVDQDRVKSFCAIPVFEDGPKAGRRDLLAVLCIDADRQFYFPYRDKNLLEFSEKLRPLITLIQFHLLYREGLLDNSVGAARDSLTQLPASPDREGVYT